MCIPVPLYHCFGMVMGNLACITHGATMVFPSEKPRCPGGVAHGADERCTALYGVPTMFIAVLDHPRFAEYDLTSLRTGIKMAGSPCPIEVMRRVVDKMHMRQVTIAYGMTETSPMKLPECGRTKRWSAGSHSGPGAAARGKVKIVDSDGRIVPRGQAGELLTRGYGR